MSIWILAIALLLFFGALGFAKGAVRMSVSFVGVILGILLAQPLSGLIMPLMGPMGVKNPVWLTLLPPAIVFLVIYLVIFFSLSFFVHHKVYLVYKYKRDDVDRIRWERMNRHVGIATGVVTASVFFFLITGLIYSAGYLTVQLSADENNPGTIRFINAVRNDMNQIGFDKAASKFAPAPKFFYESADVFGLLYHNPLLQNRLASYPYYLELGQRSEFQEMKTDKEYNDLIFGKAPVTAIIEHARTQALLSNQEILTYLKGTDIPDLKEYLRTGKSPKYDPIEILGVWTLDKSAILTSIRKANPDIRSRELRAIKAAFELVPPLTMMATPSGKVVFKAEGAEAAAPAEDPNAQAEPTGEQLMAQRYGQFRQQQPPVQPAAVPAQAPAGPQLPQLAGEGTWKEEAGGYSITAADPSGKEITAPVKIRGDEMTISTPGIPLIFTRE